MNKINFCLNCDKLSNGLRRGLCLKCYRKLYHLSLNKYNKTNMSFKRLSEEDKNKIREIISRIEIKDNNNQILKSNYNLITNCWKYSKILEQLDKNKIKELNKVFSVKNTSIEGIFERLEKKLSRHIKFNLLEGLTNKQKEIIKALVSLGYHPLGFKVYINTGEIYYFGILLGIVKDNKIEVTQ